VITLQPTLSFGEIIGPESALCGQATAAIESIANGTNPNGLIDFQKYCAFIFPSNQHIIKALTMYADTQLSRSTRWLASSERT
jgi:hypothetical protein